MAKETLGLSFFIIGICIVLVLLSLIALGPYFDYQTIVLFGLIPGLFLVSLRNDLNSINIGNREILIYATLIFYTTISVFQDINYESFTLAFNGIIGGLIASYIPIGLNKNKNFEVFFHVGFILSIIALILIEYSIGNFRLTGFASIRGSRHRFFYNANYYSYISYFANFSLFYLHLKYRNLLTTICLIILPLLLLILAFITESRSGLLFILLLNGVFWFLIIKENKVNIFQKVLKKLVLLLATIFFVLKLVDTYQNSQIKSRITSSKEDSREVLALEAINVFTDHPLIGVGLGQFPNYSKSRQFSHNSFTEVLAEHGIIGGVLIVMLFGIPTFKSLKKLRKDIQNPILRLNFLFFISFLLYNNAYVFYKASFAMIYFFLVVSIQNKNQ